MPELIKYRVGLFKELFNFDENNFIACIQEDDYWPFIFSENYIENNKTLKTKNNGLYGKIKIGNKTVNYARITKKIKIDSFDEGDTFEDKFNKFNSHAFHGDGVTIYYNEAFSIVEDKTKFGVTGNDDPYIILRLKDNNNEAFRVWKGSEKRRT